MLMHTDDILRLHHDRSTDLAKQFGTTSSGGEAATAHGDRQRERAQWVDN